MNTKLLSVLSCGILVFLIACSNGNTDQETDSDNTTLELWHYYNGDSEEILADNIEAFNSQHDIQIKAQYIPYNELYQQVSVAIAGGNLPDIILLDTVWNSAFAATNSLADISSHMEEWGHIDDFYEGPLQSAVYDDKYYGVPYTSNLAVLYYNKELLHEAGLDSPPNDWSELKESAMQLTNEEQAGVGMSAAKSENGTFAFLNFVLSAGANYDSLDTPEAKEALTYLNSLIEDGSMNADVVNLPQDDITKLFAEEKIAMMVNGSWDIGTVESLNPDLDFGVTFVPKDKEYASATGGENWTIVEGEHVDEAWEFVKWMSEPEKMSEANIEIGNIPPRTDVELHLEDKPHLEQASELMDAAIPRGPSPYWPDISEEIQTAYQSVFTDTAEPEEALKKAAEAIQATIK
ncbi:ABC transporter substrate-binding protein [Oceanobacillus sojae]|uniref:ABC transporter substrate-binding protein n=1 Tax=Oceanobacillus sojae TaxID=582851 RepID=UPI0021A80299|nr:ABC transporter substrate-binding protein [Oceanobacillus sojae]MCT1905245.1 ABC transporter substrate-binding protein [Oceanobacillus sojae]